MTADAYGHLLPDWNPTRRRWRPAHWPSCNSGCSLGSDHQGERDNAARAIEGECWRLGITWEEILEVKVNEALNSPAERRGAPEHRDDAGNGPDLMGLIAKFYHGLAGWPKDVRRTGRVEGR